MNSQLVLTWLRVATACRDRVLSNALNTGTVESVEETRPGWRVVVRSKRGTEYRIVVTQHPVTGEPQGWYRA